jgi:hypothetical protein
MSKLEQWIKAILNEDADKLSIGSVRTLQMIKHEFERLQKENEILKHENDQLNKTSDCFCLDWEKKEKCDHNCHT